ncbi:AAA family ATPase [Patescibacteria group bacterium]|nr:AAA family ATPase [Patescibacteria group bacterium]
MYLKRLEIQGFKSFANKTTLEFEKGITAIVGPNGSGKSNVADAIRWVLGEQSLKQLRGKKSEDVIFAGSEKRTKMSYATVSVTFDNTDKRIPLDYSEVSITRTIDRSGESDYLINGNKVRLLDVVDLILKSNIGTSRHTVIGQGTIDQMILSGPAEIKNLLDEASGVKSYYIRREKTLKRLEQTTQNLIRVQDLIKEIEPRLKSLRRQAKRMEERAGMEQELRSYQFQMFGWRYWQVEEALQKLSGQISGLQEQRTALEKQIQSYRSEIDKSETASQAELAEYQEIQEQLKKLNSKKNKIIEDVAVIRGKLQAEKTTDSADTKVLGIEKSDLERQIRSLQTEIQSGKHSAAEVDVRIKEQRALLNAVSGQLAEIQASMENPDNVDFKQIAREVEILEDKFGKFYDNLERANDVSAIIGFALDFKTSLSEFKKKTFDLSDNPKLSFEKQRHLLADVLRKKDAISQELNSLELKKSKATVSVEFAESELAKAEQKLAHVNLEFKKADTGNVDQYFKDLLSREKDLNSEIDAAAIEITALEKKISEYHAGEQSKKREMLEHERDYRLRQDELSKVRDRESELQIEKARLETQKENILAESAAALGSQEAERMKKNKSGEVPAGVEDKIRKLQAQLNAIGGIDELTMKEYEETEQRYTYLTSQTQDLEKGMADLRQIIDQLDEHIKKQFSSSFEKINEKFENYFRILFNGGRAYLSVLRAKEEKTEAEATEQEEEADDSAGSQTAGQKLRPEEKILAKYENRGDDVIGIDIKATPPGKKLASISALSGGERSLTSIALLCALLSCFPSPFVMLDEVDAALDEANTIRFAQILGTLADTTQFVTVTHNRETMRQGHTLYGVTMGEDGISKILSIKIEQAQAFAK